MCNYITKVIRSVDRKVVSVSAEAEGVVLSFARGPGGKPVPISRKSYVSRYYPGANWVSRVAYAQIWRQTCAIMCK